jgi:hypothetical protein
MSQGRVIAQEFWRLIIWACVQEMKVYIMCLSHSVSVGHIIQFEWYLKCNEKGHIILRLQSLLSHVHTNKSCYKNPSCVTMKETGVSSRTCQLWILPLIQNCSLFIHRRGLSVNFINSYLYTTSGNTNACVTQSILPSQWTSVIAYRKLF